MDKFTEAYNQLNAEQKLAVDTIEGPVMVLAGPGTGKTQTLALRIANILRKTQLDPQNILCLTFTENGAVAMLNRLIDFIGPPAYKVRIHTFHSFCQFLMLENLEKFPQLSEDTENLDETDKFLIIESILNNLEIGDPLKNLAKSNLYTNPVMKAISSLKKEGVSPDRLAIIIENETKYFELTRSVYEEFLIQKAPKITEDIVNRFLTDLRKVGGDNIYTRAIEELIEGHDGKSMTPLKASIKKIFEEINSEKYFPKLKSLNNIYSVYQDELVKRKTYDYEDMIMFVLDKLTTDESFLNDIQEQYQYILIDEYQDTNSAQNELIELIGSYFPNPNIFVVGDDDQSIFKFQGASLENILYFHKKYKTLKIITLKTNYRSQPKVLEASRRIIVESKNRLEDEFEMVDKNLIPIRQKPLNNIEVMISNDDQSEALLIASKVKKLLNEVEAKDIAVLLNTNDLMGLYEEVFSKAGIGCQVSKSGNTLESSHIRNILLLLEYLVHSKEELLGRIIYFDYWNLDLLDVAKTLRYSYEKRIKLSRVISTKALLQDAGVEQVEDYINFSRSLVQWQKKCLLENPAIVFPALLKETKILDTLLGEADNYQQLMKLNKLYDFLKNHLRKDENFSFTAFLERISVAKENKLSVFNENSLNSESFVNIMTVHKAKGLEFKHVFITNLTDKRWGKRQSRQSIRLPRSINKRDTAIDDFDEKVRVFFVALTRAKDKVYLSYPKHDNNGKENKPSYFISLLEAENIDKIDSKVDIDSHMQQLTLLLQPKSEVMFSKPGVIFLNKVLDNYMLSPTHFISYRLCPHCFFLNKIAKIPEVMSTSSAFGSAVHASLQDFLNKYKRTEKLPSVNYLLEVYKIALSKQIIEVADYDNYLTHGMNVLTSFYNEKLVETPITSVPELNFSSYKIRVNDVPITGKIDRIDFLDSLSGNIQVVDYKTGKRNSKKLNLEKKGDYAIQLLFYKLLIDNYKKYNWNVNEGKIVFVETDSFGKAQKDQVIKLEKQDVQWLQKEIEIVYSAIINLEFQRKNLVDCHTPELHDIKFSF